MACCSCVIFSIRQDRSIPKRSRNSTESVHPMKLLSRWAPLERRVTGVQVVSEVPSPPRSKGVEQRATLTVVSRRRDCGKGKGCSMEGGLSKRAPPSTKSSCAGKWLNWKGKGRDGRPGSDGGVTLAGGVARYVRNGRSNNRVGMLWHRSIMSSSGSFNRPRSTFSGTRACYAYSKKRWAGNSENGGNNTAPVSAMRP